MVKSLDSVLAAKEFLGRCQIFQTVVLMVGIGDMILVAIAAMGTSEYNGLLYNYSTQIKLCLT